MTKFNSKVDAWMVIVFLAIPLLLISFLSGESWIGLVVTTMIILIILALVWPTYYAIDGDKLHIRCGTFYKRTFHISKIHSYKESHELYRAPALSASKIKLQFKNGEWVAVSPENSILFANRLKRVNPKIIEK